MSFFTGKAAKANFYVEFLGWMETRGVRGERYTEPVVRTLQKRQLKTVRPPKLTIQVSQKEIKVTQDVDEGKKNIKKIKFPTIPSRDVTYAVQSYKPNGRPDDVVAIIYLGYMPRTGKKVHAHVYRFDEPDTAAKFVEMINRLTDANAARIREVENNLIAEGEIEDPRRNVRRLNNSDGMSDPHTVESPADSAASSYSDESPHFGSDEIEPDLQSLAEVKQFDSVNDELLFRLRLNDAPILLPPKDYDTIHRQQGDISSAKNRRCLNIDIIGGIEKEKLVSRDRNGSGESGIDMNSPSSSDNSTKLPGYPPEPEVRPEYYRDPTPISPMNNRRAVSARDLSDSPMNSPRTPGRDYSGYGNGLMPNSPGMRRNDVFLRQSSYEGSQSPGLKRHPNLKKSASSGSYGSDPNGLRRSYNGDSGHNSPRGTSHGRQTSQSSMYSNNSYNSYRSDGSRGSRGSNDHDEVVYPPVDDIPPDYDQTMKPELRQRVMNNPDFHILRENLGKSFPQEALRREMIKSAGPRGPEVVEVRRSMNFHDDGPYEVQYREVYSPRNGEMRVKRNHSMYR